MLRVHVAPSATANGTLEVYGAPPRSVVSSEQLRLQPTSACHDPLEQVIAEEMIEGGCEGGVGCDGGGSGGSGGGEGGEGDDGSGGGGGGGGGSGGGGGAGEGGGGSSGGDGGISGGGGGAAPQLTATSATAASPVKELPRVYLKANDGE